MAVKATILNACIDTPRTLSETEDIVRNNFPEYSRFNLAELNILPCRSCDSCSYRSPGRCVQKDDMVPVFRSIAENEVLVYVTPVTFGGYSFHLKKAIDRTMPLGAPLYFVKDGHMLHPMRYGEKRILAIGINRESTGAAVDNFRLLVTRNALNMQARCNILVTDSENLETFKDTLNKSLGELMND